MSKRSDSLLIIDILHAANKITTYCQELDFDGFMIKEMVKDAVIRNFEIIGEAAKNISLETKGLHPEVEWKLMANFRNRLIHEYFGIDYELVWDIIRRDLPKLIAELSALK